MKSFSTLQLALGVSVAIHAVLLTVRFVDPERFNRVFQDTPLEVILVNAKSKEKPDFAKAIAQASLAGGGEVEKGRATSPLPPSALMELGDATEDAQRKVEAMQEQQMQLLAVLKKQLASLPPPDLSVPANSPAQAEREAKRKQLIKILAEIEKRINEENARPKKRYVSPATREEIYAIYYDELRRKIEDKGTVNFPEQAGKKLYGELTMIVTVNYDGRVLETEVVETSGNLTLDRRAQTIVRGTGPFGRFSEAMRRKADQIVVVSRFKFTRDDTLETKLTNR
ncbi:MAG: energy transducer TonB [Polaromonas sp. 39-63-203]|uniref:energy transducer TonB n=1 Tax=Polaromonas sp. TaxID=1869339 RepID=UPI000BDAC6D5|nr:TonB C-terminal domain-containing protein [Polaromonas sp.]OYY53236.1 MAG: energy transducer TonB [Polaromonas sp. 35-63-240]OYY99585.1 MAG: energy transducer TonB [Polaromonas sp. 28-63-22]OYZ84400.1 MAG: energy transducer TonB [Polaromonas sp. 24-62-144]OZA99905.1 MAG: energy transducer TonB [Polaromonas sp. 39-63-203]HQS31249.1 TonB C-terminal domain-containing protein [Polaromonas sp.]